MNNTANINNMANTICAKGLPDFIHVLSNGKIVKTGNADLGIELEKSGYSNLS